jgi:hypothetical protein
MKTSPLKRRREKRVDYKERKRLFINPKLKKELRREFDLPEIFDKARYHALANRYNIPVSSIKRYIGVLFSQVKAKF